MKKNILCVFVATLALLAQATPVASSQATQAARAWAQRNAAFAGTDVSVAGSAVAVTNAEGVTLWYRVAMDNGSCLVMSPVTELEPVIACLESVGADGLPAAHPMRAMLERDMTDRLKKLGLYVPAPASTGPTLMGASPTSAPPEDPVMAAWAEEGKAKWARLLPKAGPQLMTAPETGVSEIAIQMGIVDGFEKGGRFTHWNQSTGGGGRCYNYHTPYHAVCGCVATSMGAMMQFFAVTGCVAGATCPDGLVREEQDGIKGATYKDSSGFTTNGFVTLGGTYDWGCLTNQDGTVMSDRSHYDSLSEEQRELLGRVAYDAGVAVAMAWTDGESGAYVMDVASALRNIFGFKDARAVFNPTEDQYVKLIYHQCRAGAPVQLGINKKEGEGGHSVLAVGFGTDDEGIPRVRVFTGWGGKGDGWYALPYITTASIPGGGSHNFDVVQQVVTMVGYDSDETVPVVGHIDAPGEAIEVPGVSRTIHANEFGYFGTRVAPGTTDCRLICRGKEAQFEIGGGAAVGEDEFWVTDADGLGAALPEEIEFVLLNSSVAYTFAKAKEMALAEGKAILRVSGVTGTEPTTNLLAYIYALDDANAGDFTNRFVYFFSSAKSPYGDGNPSFGVFLPSEAEQSGRWRIENGRLGYGYGYSKTFQITMNDYVTAAGETETPVENPDDGGYAAYEHVTNEAYVASVGTVATGTFATNSFPYTTEGMLDALQFVLDGGWDEFCRRTHGISLTVTATDEVGTPDPTYGIHENVYTNGQEITAIAPDGEVTNSEQTVVYGFGAWVLTVTNTVAGGGESTQGRTGTEATFTLASNDVATLTWQLVPTLVKINVVDSDDNGVTEPGSGWYPFGEEVTFVATPNDPDNGFSQWGLGNNGAWPRYMSGRGSPVLSFVAREPLNLIAYYGGASAESGATTNFPVRVVSVDTNGTELAADANLPAVRVLVVTGKEPVAMGGTIELPDVSLALRVETTIFTNRQGEVWECVGWTLGPDPDVAESEQTPESGTSDIAAFTPEGAAILTWVWEYRETTSVRRALVDPDDVPVGTDLTSSPITIAPNADGTLTLTVAVGNAVAGYWYAVVTDTELDGTFDEVVPRGYALADADGTLDLGEFLINPTDAKRFYKVRIYEEEPKKDE